MESPIKNERDVFIAALQIASPAERRAYLDEACAGDEALLRNVESLLAVHERAGSFLQEPALVNSAPKVDALDHVGAREFGANDTPPVEMTASTVIPSADSSDVGLAKIACPELTFVSYLAPPQEPDELGRLGHYRVLRRLGHGGMGVVFQAEDTLLGRSVALKMLLPELASRPGARERFQREARAQAQIEHDHIVPIYQVDQSNGVPFLTMPLLKGQTLDDYLRSGHPLPLRHVVRIARETASGLQAAHELGLIHRDIKPANLWLDSTAGGRVRILDFGLARAQQTANPLTASGIVMGTPAYMSPEQIASKPEPRSDLYSLGVVLYRMLAGRLPFTDADMLAQLMAIATEPVSPLRDFAPHAPIALTDLVMSLLAKAPADRPISAKVVAEALRGVQSELARMPDAETPVDLFQSDPVDPLSALREPGAAPPPVPRNVPTAVRSVRRPLVLAGWLGLAGLAIGLLVASPKSIFYRRPDSGRVGDSATAEQPYTTTPPELNPAREFSLSGHGSQVQTLVFSADSKVLISAEYWQGVVKFWDVDRHETTFEMMAVPQGSLECVALDQQRHWLAVSPSSPVGKKHPGIRLFHYGEPLLMGLLEGHTDRVLQMAFLKDGRTLLSTGYDGSIRRWDVEKQQEGSPIRARGPRIDCLNIREDGKGDLRLALAGVQPEGSQFAGLDNVVFERFYSGNSLVALSPDGTRLACTKEERMARAKNSFVSLWQVPGRIPLGELTEAPIARGLAFTPDGKHVIVMGVSYTNFYQTASGKLVARVDHSEGGISLAVSPDSRWLAVGTLKGPIHIWRLQSLLP